MTFMHGEDCAGDLAITAHTASPRVERARRCQSPSYASTGSACAHGRTLNSRCHRTRRRARPRDDETCFLLASPTIRVGGARRDRTDDLKLAKLRALPTELWPRSTQRLGEEAVVGPDRFELSTPRLSSVCSNQLSYGPSPAAVAPLDVEARAPQLGSQTLTHRADRDAREC